MIPAVMGFFAMDQMMMKPERVVRTDCFPLLRLGGDVVLINVGGVMVDHYDNTTRLGWCLRLWNWTGGAKKCSQFGNLFDPEVVSMRLFEKRTLCPNDENKFIGSVRLYVPQVPNQLDSIAPSQVARKFAIQETLVKQFKIMTDLYSHLSRMA
jgi:hypothetical protein